MEIREALPEEYAAAGAVAADAYVADEQLPDGDEYVALLRDAATRAREATLLVAVDGDRVLGTATYCPVGSPWREIGTPDEGEFRMMAVSPTAWGRGIGALLIGRCVELSLAAGHRAMVLSVRDDNRPARSLYERLGFTRAPERDWSPRPDIRLVAYTKDY